MSTVTRRRTLDAVTVYWSIHALPELSGRTRDERRGLFQRRWQFMDLGEAAAAPAAFLGADLALLVLSEWMKHTSLALFAVPTLAVGLPLAFCLGHAIEVNVFRASVGRGLPDHCRTCGYDLRASGGRCPECGADMARRRVT